MSKARESPKSDVETLLESVLAQIKFTNQKLDSLVDLNEKILKISTLSTEPIQVPETKPIPDSMTLLALPMSLRKTVMVLYKLEKATAEDLSRETGRLRAVESSAANQLVRMGYLNKKREGRDVYFFIDAYLETRK
jgi:hypothetical protein